MNRFLSSFKSRTGLVCRLLLLFFCECFGARLLWVALRTETGLCTLGTQWRDATVGWFFGDNQPIYMWEPSEQADYWLRETERVLKAHSNDARLAMGAALMLDSPNPRYLIRICRSKGSHGNGSRRSSTLIPRLAITADQLRKHKGAPRF